MKVVLSSKSCLSCLILCFFLAVVSAQEKGKDAEWESAGKQGIGTALSEKSKVWFTLQGGSLTEVFYPTADRANVQVLQFFVLNKKTGKIETERDDALHKTAVNPISLKGNTLLVNGFEIGKSFGSLSSLAFTQISRSKVRSKSKDGANGLFVGEIGVSWRIEKTYVTDPENDSIVFSVEFTSDDPNNDLYVYYDPSLANSGMHDTGWTDGNFFLSSDEQISSALTCGRCKFTDQTNGFLGVNDGLTQIKQSGKIGKQLTRVENGNLVQVAKVTPIVSGNRPTKMIFVLAFGNTPKDAMTTAYNSLQKGFDDIYRKYQEGWGKYLKTLPKIDPKYQAQFNMAAMVLRAMEDKTFRGGNVASLSKPWIPKGDAANGPYVSGYHLVWSRDLYQVATAFIAMGDKDSANRALDYLFTKQQKPDGSYPQMTWLDGRVVGDSLQMDEVAYPLILAYQLGRVDRQTYEKHIKPTADFIVKTGPTTKQERWEEKPGYSPATIAAEIAGLVCAADIAGKNGDENSAKAWLEKADDWAKNVEKWTVTTKGKYGDGNYYLRLTKNGTPDAGEKIELNNGAGTWLESEIVDAGFLELVRLGIKSPNDPLIVKSLKVVDEVLRVKTPNGAGFYRYTHDGYGEYHDGRNWNYDRTWTGKGHLWALLSGERGQYEIARSNWLQSEAKKQTSKVYKDTDFADSAVNKAGAYTRLDSMQKFANDGMMIPEQVWSQNNGVFPFGEGARSATPLAWSMAQFIRLAMNLKAGKNLDTPEVVAKRYGN